jgi:hypothetical protein
VQSQRHGKRGISTGLIVYATFLVAAIAWFTFYQFPRSMTEGPRPAAPDANDKVDRYAGAISIPLSAGRGCRQVTFDNNTGAFQETGVSTCRDEAPGTNSTEGRMNAIRNAFTGK